MTHKSIARTAAALDNARLKNQVWETTKILDHLTGLAPDFYPHHPIMKAWRGYESALIVYGMMMGLEATLKRGFVVNEFWTLQKAGEEFGPDFYYDPPAWMDDVDFLRSHRSNLIRKNEPFYGPKFTGTPVNWPYLWPFVDGEGGYTLNISKADKDRIKTGERTRPPKSVLDRVANW